MSPLLLNPQVHPVVHKLLPQDRVRARPILLHPRHQRRQRIRLSFKRHALRARPAHLSKAPCPRSPGAMAHPRHTEEAQEAIHGRGGQPHGNGQVIVEALGIEAGDFLVLLAMVEDDFPAPAAERGQIARPGADGAWVPRVGDVGVVDGEAGGVPGGIVDDVFEPFLVASMRSRYL